MKRPWTSAKTLLETSANATRSTSRGYALSLEVKVHDFRGFSLPKLREKDPELYSYVESIAR